MSVFSSEHYFFIQTIHLLSAMTFGGVVIFEVLILESLHDRLSKEIMMEIESGIIRRARKFMPVVIVLLYATGVLMLLAHFPDLSTMRDSSFGRLLMGQGCTRRHRSRLFYHRDGAAIPGQDESGHLQGHSPYRLHMHHCHCRARQGDVLCIVGDFVLAGIRSRRA